MVSLVRKYLSSSFVNGSLYAILEFTMSLAVTKLFPIGSKAVNAYIFIR